MAAPSSNEAMKTAICPQRLKQAADDDGVARSDHAAALRLRQRRGAERDESEKEKAAHPRILPSCQDVSSPA
jgi:hypothetical protein